MESSKASSVDCHLREKYGSCNELSFHREHEGKRYCVLHLPKEDKEDKFKEELNKKLENKDFNFRGVFFPSTAQFENYEFICSADFSEATFAGTANFHTAIFKKNADFSYATFEQQARFANTIFEEYATFANATFKQMANFYYTTFIKKAEFSFAIFDKTASFHETSFKKTSFSRANFKKGADFSRSSFKEGASFFAASFEAEVLFNGENQDDNMEKTLSFQSTMIDKPERFSFYTIKLRPSWFVNTDAVRKLNFTDVEWYGIPGGPPGTIEKEIEQLRERGGSDNQSSDPYELLAKTYRELSANAEENRDYPRANAFHYASMEVSRKQNHWRFGVIHWLYYLLSGYGDRPRRAFVGLVIIWLVFAISYLAIAPSSPSEGFLPLSCSNPVQLLGRMGQVAVYSLAALVRLNPEPRPGPSWFQTLVIVEGILGPLQIALFLLAVRRKVMR